MPGAITSLLSALIVVLVILLIATTGLREYIPGYPKAEYRQMLVRNALVVDSLEMELQKRDQFFRGIQAIRAGEVPEDEQTIVPFQILLMKFLYPSMRFSDKQISLPWAAKAASVNLKASVP